MAGAVAGLAAGEGTTRIRGWEAVATSYPRFADDLALLAGGGA
jgi:3-phosphoshikimate 1-carboxyvinyltransferase